MQGIEGAQRTFKAVKTLHDTIMVGPCHYMFVQTYRMDNSKSKAYVIMDLEWLQCVSAGSWSIINVSLWWWGDNYGGGCAWNICVPSSRFLCEPKSTVTKSFINKGEYI